MNDDTTNKLSNSEDSGWQETLTALCANLKTARTSALARDRFFEEYQRVCKGVALRLLSKWKWRGDVARDAEEIAAESTKILLKQESDFGGVFGSKPKTDSEFRGYLTRTIWQSCLQIALRMRRKTLLLSLDELLEAGRDFEVPHSRSAQEIRAELAEVLAVLEATRGNYKMLPAGASLLDCLLAAELRDGRLNGVKRRTLQRYAKQIREFLARHFDDSKHEP